MTFARGGGGKWLPEVIMGGGTCLGGEVWRGGCPPLHGRKNLKFHFKKAAKLAHFSSLRRVSDDFCTALYVVVSLDDPKFDLGSSNNKLTTHNIEISFLK